MFRGLQKQKTGTVSTSQNVQKIENAKREYGTTPCAEVKDRTRVSCVGEVISTRIVPRGLSHWFEVVISDGTGKIIGWFFGRNGIHGMELGSIVRFEGLVQLDEGEFTIANPYYEFL